MLNIIINMTTVVVVISTSVVFLTWLFHTVFFPVQIWVAFPGESQLQQSRATSLFSSDQSNVESTCWRKPTWAPFRLSGVASICLWNSFQYYFKVHSLALPLLHHVPPGDRWCSVPGFVSTRSVSSSSTLRSFATPLLLVVVALPPVYPNFALNFVQLCICFCCYVLRTTVSESRMLKTWWRILPRRWRRFRFECQHACGAAEEQQRVVMQQ